MYTCGPTVWNFAHVGNLRAFLFYDLLRRQLKASGYRMNHVMNLTAIDDRILDQAMHAGTTITEYAKPFIAAFFEDMRALRAEPVENYPKATEHIPEMVKMIATLLERGNAYAADGDVYFRIESFPRYGALSHLDRGGLRAGARVAQGGHGKGSARPAHGGESPRIRQDKYEKASASDFALWKRAQPGDAELGAAWDAPFGPGRPGWHIECSAMSKHFLGATFDTTAAASTCCFRITRTRSPSRKPRTESNLHVCGCTRSFCRTRPARRCPRAPEGSRRCATSWRPGTNR